MWKRYLGSVDLSAKEFDPLELGVGRVRVRPRVAGPLATAAVAVSTRLWPKYRRPAVL